MDILIPCKSFRCGKSRLAAVLTAPAREALCREMLERTLTALQGIEARIAIVTDDSEVAALAHAHGAITLPDPGLGLNPALRAGADLLGGDAPLVILPTDLPRLTAAALLAAAARPGITLVPDRHQDGTNLLVLPAAARRDFAFAYGPGSLARHMAEAARIGQPLTIHHDETLAMDIDTGADLAAWPDAPEPNGNPKTTKRGSEDAAA